MEFPQAARTISAEPTTTTELWMELMSERTGPSAAGSGRDRSGVCMVRSLRYAETVCLFPNHCHTDTQARAGTSPSGTLAALRGAPTILLTVD